MTYRTLITLLLLRLASCEPVFTQVTHLSSGLDTTGRATDKATQTSVYNRNFAVLANSLLGLTDTLSTRITTDTSTLAIITDAALNSQVYMLSRSDGVTGGGLLTLADSTAPANRVMTFRSGIVGAVWIRSEFIEKPNTINSLWAGGGIAGIKLASSVLSRGQTLEIYPGQYIGTQSDSIVLSVPGSTLHFLPGALLTGGRTYSGISLAIRFNKPFVRITADSIKLKGMEFSTKDSISSIVWINSGLKNIAIENCTFYSNFSDGCFISSRGADVELTQNIFINLHGGIGFSIYNFNDGGLTTPDSTRWYGNYCWSGQYCYGGTTYGYGKFVGNDFHSKSPDRIGGACLNLYGGSSVDWEGGSLNGSMITVTPTTSGAPIRTRVNNASGSGWKVYAIDGTRLAPDSLWLNNPNFVVDSPYVSPRSGAFFLHPNTYININGGKVRSTYNGNYYILQSVVDAGIADSSHIILNDVTFENGGIQISNNNYGTSTTARTLIDFTNVRVKILSTSGNIAAPLNLFGIRSNSTVKFSSFETYNIDSEPMGWFHHVYGVSTDTRDSTVTFDFCKFVSGRTSGMANPDQLFIVTGSQVFKHCSWEFAGTGAVSIGNNKRLTMTLCDIKTTAIASIRSISGTALLAAAKCVFDPPSLSNITASYPSDPTAQSGWSPEDSPTLKYWAKPSNAQPATDGATIVRWDDWRLDGYDLTTVAGAPLYIADGLDDKPVVRMDGNDRLWMNDLMPGDATFTIYAIVKDPGDDAAILTGLATSGLMRIKASGASTFGYYDGTNIVNSSTIATSGWHVYRWTKVGTASTLYLDGELVGSGTSISGAIAFGSIGHSTSSSPYGYGDYALIIIDSSNTTGSLDANYQGYFYREFGINTFFAGDVSVSGNVFSNGGRINLPFTVYASGSIYSLTASSVLLNFGTTDPSLTITQPGTYLIRSGVNLKYNAATFAANETATMKLRRTNNTPADLTNALTATTLRIITTITDGVGWSIVPDIIYTTTATDDAIELQGGLSNTPGAGSVDATEAFIIAVRLY